MIAKFAVDVVHANSANMLITVSSFGPFIVKVIWNAGLLDWQYTRGQLCYGQSDLLE